MATNNKKRSTSKSRSRSNSSSGRSRSAKKNNRTISDEDLLIINYAVIIGSICLCFLLFLCNFGLVGPFGEVVSGIMFGLFGKMAYVFPIILIFLAFLWISKQADSRVKIKIIAITVLFFAIAVFLEVTEGFSVSHDSYSIKELFMTGYDDRAGGGVLGGSIGFFLNRYIEKVATLILDIFVILVCVFFILGKNFIELFIDSKDKIRNTALEVKDYRREQMAKRLEKEEEGEEYEPVRQKTQKPGKTSAELRQQEREAKRRRQEEEETENILRMDKKIAGVSSNTSLKESSSAKKHEDMHEIFLKDEEPETIKERITIRDNNLMDNNIRFHIAGVDEGEEQVAEKQEEKEIMPPVAAPKAIKKPEAVSEDVHTEKKSDNIPDVNSNKNLNKKYKFPPLSLLAKSEGKGNGDSKAVLSETARKLEEALDSFGVSAKVTDISQGPSVTRYELEPAIGVKVSRITSLADDLKLHLAAKDIRIEAPIPGKSAVGIEVPNSESSGVKLRELFEDSEFKNFSGNIVFAVGKDIAGKVIVADIAKMPHMLIAGSTGSGKSVCINTIIMSIIYKHDPKDVQLIMVDPKVVELNVYNGIPHLMIPVVTDPKKAAGALNWAVAEMTDRYKKFADLNVRDLKGYNKKAEELNDEQYKHLPQILIIVDELADLMMVAAKEVEEAICRLAQLARACGIHLILATQRPSVDVITGLIKANMPSRVAFAVSSGVDSRTILDMNGAEKLLGKGDMLFYPQGYTKPARIQGAFVSDKEVSEVVDFIKDQRLHNEFGEHASEGVEKMTSSSGQSSSGSEGSEYDDLFTQAGYFIIDSGKASIGNLQRKFKIGFNRAARIMDQLCEAGVVGSEQGTKPREVIMSREQFEVYVDEYV